MVNDTISDMLTRIRNANNAKHHFVEVPFTKMTSGMIKILKDEGFIQEFKISVRRNLSGFPLAAALSNK